MSLLSNTYLKLTGWKLDGDPPKEVFEKCVIICAPHTTNWDFPNTWAIMDTLNVKTQYAIKKEAMGFPMGGILRQLGCIPIDRSKKEGKQKTSTVDAIANLFEQYDKLCLMIAAEGTRSLCTKWKTGFYYIALKAKVPICLGYLDYTTKTGGIPKVIYPTGDIHKDMGEIMRFYQSINPKFPEKFSVDERYLSNQ